MTEAVPVGPADLRDAWPALTPEERVDAFRHLSADAAGEFFETLSPLAQAQIVTGLPEAQRRVWLRLLAPDDLADVIQEAPPGEREALLAQLDERSRREVRALLAYAEDDAGGLMSPRFAHVRPDMSVDEAIAYLRRQARDSLETIYYVYALDPAQRLLGVVSFRDLFAAPERALVRDVMHTDLVVVHEQTDQETVARLFAEHDLLALPVVDAEDRLRGIVTIDDIVDVVEEEATEDQQKYGGMEALERPYLQTGFWQMIKKRAGWLAVLFLGEMLTASAMGRYEHALTEAVVLALFVPLIISSGGNTGSQASTLIIRAMALDEVRPRDWWRIARRELAAGFTRIFAWEAMFGTYGEQAGRLAVTVGISLLAVVTWGALSGSMLPFVMRRLRFDPASASAPFVATLVDVLGLVIYFTTAQIVLL
jgi:magnesium transporter